MRCRFLPRGRQQHVLLTVSIKRKITSWFLTYNVAAMPIYAETKNKRSELTSKDRNTVEVRGIAQGCEIFSRQVYRRGGGGGCRSRKLCLRRDLGKIFHIAPASTLISSPSSRYRPAKNYRTRVRSLNQFVMVLIVLCSRLSAPLFGC